MKTKYIVVAVLIAGFITACSSSKKAAQETPKTAEQVFEDAFEDLNETSSIEPNGLDRSIRPGAGEAKDITIGNYESFTLANGLKVFVIENHKLPTISYSLSVEIDPIVEGNKAGYTGLVGDLLSAGTKTKTKEQLDESIDFMGASIGASSQGVYASGLSKYKGEMMSILSDVLLNPVFPKSEFDKLIKQSLTGLEASKDNPDAITGNIKNAVLYGKNHPYGEIMTEATVKNITLEDCKKYYNTYFRPNAAILTIVGDVTIEEAKELANKNLAAWKKKEVTKKTYTKPALPTAPQVIVVNKDGAVQSNIGVGNVVSLKLGDADYEAVQVFNEIFGGSFSGRLFQNLREDKEFTYGAYGDIDADKLVGSFYSYAKVRNEVTDSAVEQFLFEMNRIRTELVGEEELQSAKNYLAGVFAQRLESPRTIASFASNIDRYNLSKDYFKDYLKRIQAVTSEDIKRVANTYVLPANVSVIVVGDAAAVGPKLARFGKVVYMDKEANVTEAPKKEEVADNVTAETVIKAYIEAIGGEAKLKAVKTIKTEMAANLQGMDLTMVQTQAKPNKTKVVMSMRGMNLMEQTFDGTKAKVVAQGMEQPLEEKDIKAMAIDNMMFGELFFKENGVKTELKGIKEINGVKAYEVEVITPLGQSSLNYFNKETGFKIRETKTEQGPEGEVSQSTDYSDYKEVNGIKFPHTVKMPLGGGMDLNATVISIEVDGAVDATIFEVK